MSWRWIFLVNAPVGVVAIEAGTRVSPLVAAAVAAMAALAGVAGLRARH